jgi:hypothetical protein
MLPVPTELNVLVLLKGSERYIYVYDDCSQAALLEAIREQAADPRLSLSWFDASVLARKACEQVRQQPALPPPGPRRIGEGP